MPQKVNRIPGRKCPRVPVFCSIAALFLSYNLNNSKLSFCNFFKSLNFYLARSVGKFPVTPFHWIGGSISHLQPIWFWTILEKNYSLNVTCEDPCFISSTLESRWCLVQASEPLGLSPWQPAIISTWLLHYIIHSWSLKAIIFCSFSVSPFFKNFLFCKKIKTQILQELQLQISRDYKLQFCSQIHSCCKNCFICVTRPDCFMRRLL